MGLQVTLEDRIYSAIDYMHLYTKERIELVKGRLRKMSPSPSYAHQKMIKNLISILEENLKEGMVVIIAPFDVYLDDDLVVQPDLLICRENQISKRGCEGAPYLVVEVVSPSSKAYDEGEKKEIYQEYGVKEYWLAYPESGGVTKLNF